MTCAANAHQLGKAFPGQMEIFRDKHLEGLRRIAYIIQNYGGISLVLLHHGGARVSSKSAEKPVGPSPIPAIGVRGLILNEVEELRGNLFTVAQRAERAGFDGIELHAAYGWILMEVLLPLYKRRTDKYGGFPDKRARLLFEVIDGIRSACGPNFQISLRLSMDRYGVALSEIHLVAARAMREEKIDYLDLADWDYREVIHESPFAGRTLLSVFTELPRSSGHVMTLNQAAEVLDAGCDFVMLENAAILDPDFLRSALKHADYHLTVLPVTDSYLRPSGLSERFIDYKRTWPGFVASDSY